MGVQGWGQGLKNRLEALMENKASFTNVRIGGFGFRN